MSQVVENTRKLSEGLQRYNPADLAFAKDVGERISLEWDLKFKTGALEHGGIDKPPFSERKGLVRESLNEAYDLLSYLHNLDHRLRRAREMLAHLRHRLDDPVVCNSELQYSIDDVVNLLE